MELFPHQIAALEQTKGLNRVAYYLDMGLGKTFVGSEKMVDLNADVNLVVCQKSKVQDWIDHFKQHYSSDPFLYIIYDLTEKKQFEAFLQETQDAASEPLDPRQFIGVINYDLIFRRPELLKLDKFTLMLDESSLIQNEMAKRTKSILKMRPDNVILLSGTPTGGKYENLWSQLHLLGWGISKKVFWQQYIVTEWIEDPEFGIQIPRVIGYKNVERLKQKLRDHGAVFMKAEECFDLPEQTFIDVPVKPSKEYRKFKTNRIVSFDDDVQLVGDTTLTQMLGERQLCGMYSANKMQAFKDLLISTQDRLIVFYNFDEELVRLKNTIIDMDRPISQINGHLKDLKAYEEADNSVTLVQYQAGAMGLNLQKANKVIFFTLPLMSELFEQSKKRIHRIGQTQACFYYILTVKNSVECRIKETLEMRKDYTDDLFELDQKEGV